MSFLSNRRLKTVAGLDDNGSAIAETKAPSWTCPPRLPTTAEKADLLNLINASILDSAPAEVAAEMRADNANYVSDSYIAIYDSYRSDADDAYSGRLMVVVWPSATPQAELFGWVDSKLTTLT